MTTKLFEQIGTGNLSSFHRLLSEYAAQSVCVSHTESCPSIKRGTHAASPLMIRNSPFNSTTTGYCVPDISLLVKDDPLDFFTGEDFHPIGRFPGQSDESASEHFHVRELTRLSITSKLHRRLLGSVWVCHPSVPLRIGDSSQLLRCDY